MGSKTTVLLTTAAVATTMSIVCAPQSSAHDWYPKECCSDSDCTAAERVLWGYRGDRTVFVGGYQIPIPRELVARSSPDGRVHICFRVNPGQLYDKPDLETFCLFLPEQS